MRVFFAILAGLFIVIAALASRPAHAARVVCGEWKAMEAALAKKFREGPIGEGVGGAGSSRIVLYASPDGSSFSIFAVYPDGTACLIGGGIGWEMLPPPPSKKDGERES